MQTDYRIATVKEDKKMNRIIKNLLLLDMLLGLRLSLNLAVLVYEGRYLENKINILEFYLNMSLD